MTIFDTMLLLKRLCNKMNKIRINVIYLVLSRGTVQVCVIINLVILGLRYERYEMILRKTDSNR